MGGDRLAGDFLESATFVDLNLDTILKQAPQKWTYNVLYEDSTGGIQAVVLEAGATWVYSQRNGHLVFRPKLVMVSFL